MDLLATLRQRQHALTLPNWAWTGSAKGMVWQEIQDAIECIESLRALLAGQADAALAVWNRAIKAETRCRELEQELARLTLIRSNDALDSVNGGGAGRRRAAAVADVDARRDAQPGDVPQGQGALREHEAHGVH